MHPMTRRRLLAAGLGIPLAGGAGASLSLLADERRHLDAEAYRAWNGRDKGALGDAEYLVRCAGLAPSAHNTQPWRFRLHGDHIELLADPTRHLGRADPERRMMQLSLGCALENLAVAATRLGYEARVEALDADARFSTDGHVARVRLVRRAERSHPWFDALFERRTSRGEYNPIGEVPAAMREALAASLAATDSALPGVALHWLRPDAALQALVRQSVRGFLTDGRHHDGMAWFRLTRDEWERRRDGIAIFNSGAPFVAQRYVEWFATERDLLGEPFRQGEIDAVDRVTAATPAWGLVSAAAATPSHRVQAGRLAERVYLEATTRGLAVQPLCYPTEVPVGTLRLAQMAGLPPRAEPLMLFRLGRAAPGPRSVRRALRDLIVA